MQRTASRNIAHAHIDIGWRVTLVALLFALLLFGKRDDPEPDKRHSKTKPLPNYDLVTDESGRKRAVRKSA